MVDYEQAVFISYAWGGESEEIVDQIDEALQLRGLTIIRDKRDLGYKGSISAFMERIGQGNCVIVVISDKYLRSPNCMFELVEIAEGKEFHDRVFPIVLSNAEIYDPVKRLGYVKHWEDKLAELDQAMRDVKSQANLQGVREDIDQYSRFRDKVSGLTSILKDMNTLTPEMHKDSDFSEIYDGIERRMVGASGELKSESGESPYMGLKYFDTSDADLFFGREALTGELAERVSKESFLAIVGASGSGKSSVARAGLIPTWKKGNEKGTVHVITPTTHPLESLAASLTRDSESVTATSTLIDDMKKDSRSLRLYVRKLLNNLEDENFLLVVDQFEETFTLCKDLDERKAFIENLLALADEENNSARVVITLRADFYHHCFEYESLLLELNNNHQANIQPMTQDELREAITAPAENNGWDFQPGLVDLILQDIGTEPGALPLLSHALHETWKRRQGRTLTLGGYHEAGGVKKAIAQTAESVYGNLSTEEQSIARNIFLRLTELGEGEQDTRRRVKMDELAQTKEQNAVAKVLNTLADARLVTTEQDSAEVAHEALIREWGTLRKWLNEDRESVRIQHHLAESAQEWERRGRESSELYRGTRLKEIQEWMKEHKSGLSDLEKEFLKTSQNKTRKDRLRWGAVLGIGVVLSLAAIIVGATGRLNRYIYPPLPTEFVLIPAGDFIMGDSRNDASYNLDAKPAHMLRLNAFFIEKYEVTNDKYAQCVKARVCRGGGIEYFDVNGNNLNSLYDMEKKYYPVVNISWFQANAYCDWIGARLPSEAEWEKAARGTDSFYYPWGDNTATCELANFNNGDENGCIGDTTPVGNYPGGQTEYGVNDLYGNVWEWTSSLYRPYPYDANDGREDISTSGNRVLRGGSWQTDIEVITRFELNPSFTSYDFGFRCVKDIKEIQ